ncbi:hypothetical protein NZK32_16115 [Cyanobium sp. FGCU-52]|nr:hypothetical protein [Cyanobium sp. FGCU52]
MPLRRLLLLPLLSPLLAAVLVGALNPRPAVSLRLLTWSSPSLPIGAWIAAAAGTGAALSGGAAALAIGEAGGGLRRRVRRRQGSTAAEPAWSGEVWDEFPSREAAQAPPRRDRRPQAVEVPPAWGAGPSRAPGEPAPTVAVPFRVLRRGEGVGMAPAESARQAAQQRRTPEPLAVAADEDWGASAQDDW